MSLLSRLRKLEGATADWRADERDACATYGYPHRAAVIVMLHAANAGETFPRCPACDRRLVPQCVVQFPGLPSPAGRPLGDRRSRPALNNVTAA
jgi:hypothetical protein